MNSNILKKRKIKKKSNRKWTVSEILRVIEFIHEEREFEKPTAQVYYKKFLERTNIGTTWSLIRWKVRYLRTTLKKAQDWRKSKEAALLKTEQGITSVKEKLKKICPYYDQLNAIFGETSNTLKLEIYDSETKSSLVQSSVNESLFSPDEEDGLIESIPSFAIKDEQNCPLESAQANIEQLTTHSPAGIEENIERAWRDAEEPQKSLDQVTTVKTERTELQRIKIDFETKKFNVEIEVCERKLQLKEMKILEEIERRKEEMDIRRRELDFRKLQMEKDERLRRLEIEKQERVEKYEIDMRYKYGK